MLLFEVEPLEQIVIITYKHSIGPAAQSAPPQPRSAVFAVISTLCLFYLKSVKGLTAAGMSNPKPPEH